MFDTRNLSEKVRSINDDNSEYIPPDHLGFPSPELSNIDKVKKEISALELDNWELRKEIKEKDEEIYKLKDEIDKLESEISYLRAISD